MLLLASTRSANKTKSMTSLTKMSAGNAGGGAMMDGRAGWAAGGAMLGARFGNWLAGG